MRRVIVNRLFICAVALAAITTFARPAAADVLAVDENIQEAGQWCWAAVSRSILAYYGFEESQCAIANYTREVADWHNFGTIDCCEKANGLCNYWNYLWGFAGSVQEIVAHFAGATSEGVSAPLTAEECTAQIAAARPFVIRWLWDSGSGHFVLGHGIDPDGTFYYMDPWFGEGYKISTYDWMVDGDDHEWTHTLTMLSDPCECHVAGDCCDGCRIINDGGACNADENGCTVGDICTAGTCVAGLTPDCTAQDDQCNAGFCESTGPDTWTCAKDPTQFEGRPCNADDDGCTVGDICTEGACVAGVAAECTDDAGQCAQPACLSIGPDQYECTTVTEYLDGVRCDDENPCTLDDICAGGECSGAEKDCSDSFACTVTWCDPATGECTAETNDATCDDGNSCTTDTCSAMAGCEYSRKPDWLECSGPEFACFGGHCEQIAVDDTFKSPTTIVEGVVYYSDFDALHQYLGVPAACFGSPADGHDAFYVFFGTSGTTYTLTMTPDEGVMAAVAIWKGIDEEADCSNGIAVTNQEESIDLPSDTTGGVIVQTIITDCTNATGSRRVAFIVNSTTGGDEIPDTAEGVTDDTIIADSDPADAFAGDSSWPQDTVEFVEPAPDAFSDTTAPDFVASSDIPDSSAHDTLVPADSSGHDIESDGTGAELNTTDAGGNDAFEVADDDGGSGCSSGSRGSLPATASLIFLMATAFALSGLVRRLRNKQD